MTLRTEEENLKTQRMILHRGYLVTTTGIGIRYTMYFSLSRHTKA